MDVYIMQENSDKYIVAFNQIEKYLKNKKGANNQSSFTHLVNEASKDDPILRKHKTDLLQFANLRNAIIHERIDKDFIIAEPHDDIVEKIISINEEIQNPEKVFPKFSNDVKTFETSDSLADVLKIIKELNYSQFPIYQDGHFIGLLTANGIANWLAQNIEEDIVSITETTIKEVQDFDELQNNYKFVSRNLTIYEAELIFKEPTKNGVRLEALLITHSGKTNQSLIGIISAWDVL